MVPPHSKALLAHCTPHGTFCKMEWRLHNSVWVFGDQKLCVLLAHELDEAEIVFITEPLVVQSGGALLHQLEEVLKELAYPLLAGRGENLHHSDSVRVRQIPSHYGVCRCSFDTVWRRSVRIICDSEGQRCVNEQQWPAIVQTCASHTHTHTPCLLSQTLPANPYFCTGRTIAGVAGGSVLLNFLQNALYTVTKLFVV